jgi:hypothetical protein
MITLDSLPKNKDKFIRLLEFGREILGICDDLNISPVLNGSLAVFAYTKNTDINVNDIDMLIPEDDFSKIIPVLEERGIEYKLKEYHVLQVFKDDLKIDFDSIDYWPKVWKIDLPQSYEIIQISGFKVRIIGLGDLIQTYKIGSGGNEKRAEDYKSKLEALQKIDSNPKNAA